jgi:hypothetical protein
MSNEKRVRIIRDDMPSNPRTDFDCNVGRMVCCHSRYNLGDEHYYSGDNWKFELACEVDPDLEDRVISMENDTVNVIYSCLLDDSDYDFDDAWARADDMVRRGVERMINRVFCDNYIALPLYLYDHSGISMSTGSFSCPWDSGCVGVIVCHRDTVKKEFDGDEDRARKALEAEVEVYDQYLRGDVYGFIVEMFDGKDWNEIDSCWGFFGSDIHTNGMVDHFGADLVDYIVYDD